MRNWIRQSVVWHRRWNSTLSRKNSKTLSRLPSFVNISPKVAGNNVKTAEEAVNNILYNNPEPSKRDVPHIHTLSVFVDNEAGVLSKVSGLLSARGFNIDSLSVANTDVKELSRMTIRLKGPDSQIEQAKRQLVDLVPVWHVVEYKQPELTFERELCLVKVSTIPEHLEEHREDISAGKTSDYETLMAMHFHREAIESLTRKFGGQVSDVGNDSMIVELSSWSRRVDAFIKMLQPFGVVEAARTGVIAMKKSPVVSSSDSAGEAERKTVDISELPPS
eukprot:snap_masked-scaffold_7-processed-gene-12.31-mRNA-1 protein AED:0.04 eAED:0.04 QI:0/-1/0/1/-1/1/1/0/276